MQRYSYTKFDEATTKQLADIRSSFEYLTSLVENATDATGSDGQFTPAFAAVERDINGLEDGRGKRYALAKLAEAMRSRERHGLSESPNGAQELMLALLEESYMWVGKSLRDSQIARTGVIDELPERNDDRRSYLLQFFKYEHLPQNLQVHSKPWGDLARLIDRTLPENPEKSTAMRKLLEGKDCAVRAMLFQQATSGTPTPPNVRG